MKKFIGLFAGLLLAAGLLAQTNTPTNTPTLTPTPTPTATVIPIRNAPGVGQSVPIVAAVAMPAGRFINYSDLVVSSSGGSVKGVLADTLKINETGRVIIVGQAIVYTAATNLALGDAVSSTNAGLAQAAQTTHYVAGYVTKARDAFDVSPIGPITIVLAHGRAIAELR